MYIQAASIDQLQPNIEAIHLISENRDIFSHLQEWNMPQAKGNSLIAHVLISSRIQDFHCPNSLLTCN